MSSAFTWTPERRVATSENVTRPSVETSQNLTGLREAALTLMREVESLTNVNQPKQERRKLALHEEVQNFEIDLICKALQRTRGNQRRAAKLLGVKVSTLNCKIKRFNISLSEYEREAMVLV
jgi:transcriptional regulator with GAF, ATPase, and Fis domain